MSDDEVQINHLKKAVEDAVRESTDHKAMVERLNGIIIEVTLERNQLREKSKEQEYKINAADWFMGHFIERFLERIEQR